MSKQMIANPILNNKEQHISIMGKDLLVKSVESIRNYVWIDESSSSLVVEFIPSSTNKNQRKINNLITKFLYERLKSYIHNKAIHYADTIGVKINQIRIKNIKSRWGSCSSLGNLNFSIYLIFKPISCIDYVVAHEVCHLKEMNHSKSFWALVSMLCPNYRGERKLLNSKQPINSKWIIDILSNNNKKNRAGTPLLRNNKKSFILPKLIMKKIRKCLLN